jgi:hypothetical protein
MKGGMISVWDAYRFGYQVTPIHARAASGRNAQKMKRAKSRYVDVQATKP